jgi:hypothetical protein
MESVFSLIKYAFLGVFGLVAILFVFALVFGKKIVKKWEFEAKIRDASGRELGEFDIELSRIAKGETEDSFKAKFKLCHETLGAGQRVQVYLDDALVLEGHAETAGQIYLGQEDVVMPLTQAEKGQMCRVVYGGIEQFRQGIIPD